MELLLKTTRKSSLSTQGQVLCNDQFSAFTLELPFSDGLPGGAIPPGRYQVVFQPSPKFMANPDPWIQCYAAKMPHIIGIPGRSLIMWHWGNKPTDTDGCVLVGLSMANDSIGQSRVAFERFYETIEADVEAGNCWVTVTRD